MAAVVFQKRSLPRGVARSYCKGGGTGKSPKIAAEYLIAADMWIQIYAAK
jgi:hypothetical protein